MGADTFECTARGEGAKEAFNNAVQQAQYDYGHAGYTGTIAEKPGYEMVSLEPMSVAAAGELASRLIREADPRIDDKWGPAGCIPLEDGSFFFFGWASC